MTTTGEELREFELLDETWRHVTAGRRAPDADRGGARVRRQGLPRDDHA